MKNMRKLFAMVLAVMMVLSLATTAFAAEADLTGHTYKAYQIFTGTQKADSDELAQVEWGSGIDAENFLTALKAATTFGETNPFANCETAADVAEAMKGWADKSDNAKAFAALAYDYKTGDGITCQNGDTLDAGYYLVVDVTEFAEGEQNTVYNTALLQLTQKGTFEIANKTDVPEVEKKIVEGETKYDAADSEIGKTINYEFTGTMPSNIADYDTYYYVFTDTMSKGLTYTNTLKVTVNGKVVTDYFYSNVTTDATTGETTLVVGMQDILALELLEDPAVGDITADTKVVVTYTAMLNEDAVVGVEGNPNDVKLDYSNNPNDDGDGATEPPEENPDKPEPSTPTGETPKDTVIVYTTEIELTKVDSETQETLTGAKFQISGISSKVKIINKEMYVPYGEDEEAVEGNVWYMLKDGTYTQTVPAVDDPNTEETNEDNTAAYDSTTKTYKKIEVVTTETVEEEFVAEGWVNADGVITFTGLGEGTYEIEEIVAPDGYNLLTTPITVVISSDAADITDPTAETEVEWSATVNDEEATINNGIIEITVENTSGSTLPETGGMGTTLFYLFGGIMVLAAVVLLVTKKRMATAE